MAKSKRTTKPRRNRKPKQRRARRARAQQQAQLVRYNSISNKPVTFTKTIFKAGIFNGLGVATSSVNAFSVQFVPDIGSIAALYNRYKLNKVTLTFRLKDNASDSGANFTTAIMPTMMMRYNYDSYEITSASTTATVLQKLQEVNNVKQVTFTPMMTQFQYTIVPRTIAPVYLSAVATGYELQPKRYIDIAYNNVPHYGIMWYADYVAPGLSIEVDFTYNFTCKYSE